MTSSFLIESIQDDDDQDEDDLSLGQELFRHLTAYFTREGLHPDVFSAIAHYRSYGVSKAKLVERYGVSKLLVDLIDAMLRSEDEAARLAEAREQLEASLVLS